MLELKNIKKDYPAGDGIVHALKGVSLQFRKNEFVSILGPSGCGKTTLLNIIGGLDHYTSGDLIINGKSTKDFKSRDWDTYRNHSVGFVFQSYNLIPHQNVLQNVELALTLTGVSKSERRERAKKALEQVGLGNQLHKKPSQMSGGQMQRVAIARALVNNPDIILADEPTGALDSETSVQVMEILKEISKEKLIVMVTHNPELAEQYSNRIIRVLDGEIKSDSHPLTEEDLKAEKALEQEGANNSKKKKKMPSMSLGTSFSLSLKNLIAKGGRTTLTSFAGSIGIIGIALIFAVSQGLTSYIDMIQENTLSSYPLTIQSSSVDVSTLMSTFMGIADKEITHEKDAVYPQSVLYDMMDAMNNIESVENDLVAFKKHIEEEYNNSEGEGSLNEAVNGIQYTYDTQLLVYTKNADGDIIHSDTTEILTEMMSDILGSDMSSMASMTENTSLFGMDASASPMYSMSQSSMKLWQELLPGDDGKLVNELLEKQYDVIYGSWPTEYNEVVLVVDENNELDDLTLYALGLESKDQIEAIKDAAVEQKELKMEDKSWSYEEICDKEYITILNSDCYSYDQNTGMYTDLRDTEAGLKYLYDNGIPLKVSGIIRQNEDVESAMLTGSIAYTSELTKYIIEHSKVSEAVKAQLEKPATDIFTNLPFKENTGNLSEKEKETEFRAYVEELSEEEKAATYVKVMSIPSEEELNTMIEQAMTGVDRTAIEATMTQAMVEQLGMKEDEISGYLADMSDEDLFSTYRELVGEQIKKQYADSVEQQMAMMTQEQKNAAFSMAMDGYTTEQCAVYYDEIMEFSESTYENNLSQLGYVDLNDPASINFYASTFENKDIIEAAIEDYNDKVDEVQKIQYTDYVGLMMSSVTSIINAITYVLIAFVAISLIVSSIMIAVITLISVQERTKEIGILRAMGASKHDVSVMFNAETVLIGFASGTLGVVITYLLCIPINSIIHSLTGINNLSATLPWQAALIFIAISVVLNLFSGFIPAKSAARKDPVVALRSE